MVVSRDLVSSCRIMALAARDRKPPRWPIQDARSQPSRVEFTLAVRRQVTERLAARYQRVTRAEDR